MNIAVNWLRGKPSLETGLVSRKETNTETLKIVSRDLDISRLTSTKSDLMYPPPKHRLVNVLNTAPAILKRYGDGLIHGEHGKTQLGKSYDGKRTSSQRCRFRHIKIFL